MFRKLSLSLMMVVGLTLPTWAQSCPDGNCPRRSGGDPFGPQTGVSPYPRWNSRAVQPPRPRWQPAPSAGEESEQHPTARPVQRACPVTGEALGSMGRPARVTVLGRTIQVCCADCITAVRHNPQKYFQRVAEEVGQAFPTAVPARTSNSGRWGGQILCPVTDETLGSMGEPIAIRLGERTLYVCCQACVNAVKRNPERYLRKVDAELPTLQHPERAPRQIPTRWGGQKACPVTGEALGDMGEPIPIELGDRTMFVCCESCVDEVSRSPAKYLRRVDQELGTLSR